MSQFFRVLTTVIDVFWIIAVLYAMHIHQERTKSFQFFASFLVYTMALNVIQIWK